MRIWVVEADGPHKAAQGRGQQRRLQTSSQQSASSGHPEAQRQNRVSCREGELGAGQASGGGVALPHPVSSDQQSPEPGRHCWGPGSED